jgi:hypothetical protein
MKAWTFAKGRTLAAVGTLLFSVVARAEVCAAGADASPLDAVDVERRLVFLASEMDAEVHRLHVWSWSWGTGYAAAAVAQGAALAWVDQRDTRETLAVGAVSAAIGSGFLFGLPLTLTVPIERLRASWGRPNRCALLADAERGLRQAAERERVSTSWSAHVGNLAFNGGLVLILGLGFGQWKAAAISAGIGVAVGEANLLTQPHGLPDALRRYEAGQLGPEATPTWTVVPLAAPHTLGASLSLRW